MKHLSLLLLLFGLIAQATSVASEADKDARKAVDAAYKQMNKGYLTGDITLIQALFSPESKLRFRGEGPTVGGKSFINATTQLLKARKILRSTTSIQSFKPAKDGYVAIVVWVGESEAAGAARDKSAKPLHVEQKIWDTWKKTDKGWKILSRQVQD